MSEQYSALSGLLIPFCRIMERNDINIGEALEICNIKKSVLNSQESRLPVSQYEALIDHCNAQLNRHDFAILIAKHFHPGMFHILGYAIMSSNTLSDALHRIAQYKSLIANSSTVEINQTNRFLNFNLHTFREANSKKLVAGLNPTMAFIGTTISFCRTLIGTDFNPLKVYFSYPKPNFDTQFINDFFQCDIKFNANASGFKLDKKVANKPLEAGNSSITLAHEKLLNEALCRMKKSDIEQQVRSFIQKELMHGTPSQSKIAEKLGMSLRNLQRRLNEKGNSFKDILEDTRKKLALDYIKQTHLSLGEVSYLIGFSNLSNFNRAFKRWTGTTPGEYRNKSIEENYLNAV